MTRSVHVKLQLEQTVTFESASGMHREVLLSNLLLSHALATHPDTSEEDKAVFQEQVRILKYEVERRMNG